MAGYSRGEKRRKRDVVQEDGAEVVKCDPSLLWAKNKTQ
jgi:hypothetical protein